MVKMSLDPVQVASVQVQELKVAPSSNGDFDQDCLGLTNKPTSVSLKVSQVPTLKSVNLLLVFSC